MPSVLALFAHPDDIEFVAAGTMLLLQERGWDLHYMNLCTGNGARSQMAEALLAARAAGTVEVASAGSHPKPVHKLAIAVMGAFHAIRASQGKDGDAPV